MKSNYKIKSFGIVEAVIASMIVIIVLSAAVFLSMSATKTTEVNSSYNQAQHIADLILERLQLIKSNGRLYFDERSGRGSKMISVDCFDTSKFSTCLSDISEEYPLDQFPYIDLQADSEDYIIAPDGWFDKSVFGADYFKFKVSVKSLPQCHGSGDILIDKTKCRTAEVNVKWEEQSREQNYKQAVYITDWER